MPSRYKAKHHSTSAVATATLHLAQRVCDTRVDTNNAWCCTLLCNVFAIIGAALAQQNPP